MNVALEGVSALRLPPNLQQMWLPVVRHLHQRGLSHALITRAMEGVYEVPSLECSLRLCWAGELVSMALELPVEKRDLSQQQVLSLINVCMQKPSKPMLHLLHGFVCYNYMLTDLLRWPCVCRANG